MSIALEKAAMVRERCAARGLAIDRDVTDAEGGRTLIFFGTETSPGGSHRLLATITCDDDGDITVLTQDRQDNGSMEAWPVDDIDASLDRIAKHLLTTEAPEETG